MCLELSLLVLELADIVDFILPQAIFILEMMHCVSAMKKGKQLKLHRDDAFVSLIVNSPSWI
jgi:hypothetical protein